MSSLRVVAAGSADRNQSGEAVGVGQSGPGVAVNTQTRRKRDPARGEGHGLCSSCCYIMRQKPFALHYFLG